jgi:membrane protease YdiL (CAAX protease family)
MTTISTPTRHHPVAARSTVVIASAWLGTLLLSRLPQIILSELGVISPSAWSVWWWIIMGTALFALTYVWALMSPLRGYFLVLTMIYVVTMVRLLLEQTSIWVSWFGPDRSWVASFFGERLGIILLALGLVGVLVLLGNKSRDYFLTLGDVNAPALGMRLPWRENPLPWTIAAPLVTLPLTALITAGILVMNTLARVTIAEVILLLPAVFIFALMNAFGEEMAYRAVPLSQLWQVVGKKQAIWMTALWFGIGHYYGGISFGVMGAVYLTLVAVLFGKAMLETKGLAMPVFMHLWGDVVLYFFLALGTV